MRKDKFCTEDTLMLFGQRAVALKSFFNSFLIRLFDLIRFFINFWSIRGFESFQRSKKLVGFPDLVLRQWYPLVAPLSTFTSPFVRNLNPAAFFWWLWCTTVRIWIFNKVWFFYFRSNVYQTWQKSIVLILFFIWKRLRNFLKKAGRMWCGGAREAHMTRVTMEWLLAKPRNFSNLPAF